MVRESFNEQLNKLRNDILLMGKMVGNAIELSIDALKRQDLDLAEQVVMDDEKIDRLELEIERGCLSLLALQQPMARDLRFIGTALKISTDLERMGDYASNIAKVVLLMGNEPVIKPLKDIPLMSDLVQLMVRENLTAYINQDSDLALKSAMRDHDINNYYSKTFNELIDLMTRDPGNVKQATCFLFIVRHLERIGDHATNLSEWIIYMITGERLELNQS